MRTSASGAQAEMPASLRAWPSPSHAGCVESQVTGHLIALKKLVPKAVEKEVCADVRSLPKQYRCSLLIVAGAKSGGKGFTKGDSKTSAKGRDVKSYTSDQWGPRGTKRNAAGYDKR